MVRLISNRNGSRGGFNAVVLSAALADGQLRAAQEAHANKVADTARALAAAHHNTGDLERSIMVRNIRGNRSDLEIVATDRAAAHIEFGHLTGQDGDVDRKWVEGLHIMRDAALAHGGIVRFP